jgi:hypothetical protein
LSAEDRIVFTPVIRAMPTISAAAVIAVRRGLRAELRRPSLPGIDQENSRPITPTTGREIKGVSSATPMKLTSTPARMPQSVASPSVPARPSASTVPPAAPTSAPTMVIRVSGRSGVAASCMAATGGIRDARRAGSSAARTVTSRPTVNAAMIAAGGTPIPASCRSPPPMLPNT